MDKQRFRAAMLLLWSRTLEEHGLKWDDWLRQVPPDIVRGVEDDAAIQDALDFAERHPEWKPSFF